MLFVIFKLEGAGDFTEGFEEHFKNFVTALGDNWEQATEIIGKFFESLGDVGSWIIEALLNS